MCQNGSFWASKLPENWFHEKIWVTEKWINFYTVVLQFQKGKNDKSLNSGMKMCQISKFDFEMKSDVQKLTIL